MTSAVENTNVQLNENEHKESFDKQDLLVSEQATELEHGRILRRPNATNSADKQTAGPVLRTTVKPVKRFRPDSNIDKTNPSPSRKKRVKSTTTNIAAIARSHSDDYLLPQTEASSKDKSNLVPLSSPERKATSEATNDKGEKGEVSSSATDGLPPKKKRVWEQWSVEDKNYFFEAVAVYGKDFESIRTAIAQKHRKKGEQCVAKTKDQVRHLYYRTWTTISKIIDADAYPLSINKAFHELYAVINYGEIRKKLGGNLKKKGIEKLNELIRDGTTSARVKGKNFRIKTPSCKALKKMNPEYRGKEGISDLPLVSDTRRMKIPLHVVIELVPLTMAAWNQVHSIAHNPRLRIRLSVDSQLSSIFTYLEKKWKPLSGRLAKVANQCQSKISNNSAVINQIAKAKSSSMWDSKFVLQTPPDGSLNSRIMVFQVTNNKTHCVVSYALCKSVQQSPVKLPENSDHAKKPVNAETTENKDNDEGNNNDLANGTLSESEVIDSSLSSEEEFDYDSANEDALKLSGKDGDDKAAHNASPVFNTSISLDSPKADCESQSLDTSFVIKEKDCNGIFSPETPNDSENQLNEGEDNIKMNEYKNIAAQVNCLPDKEASENNMDKEIDLIENCVNENNLEEVVESPMNLSLDSRTEIDNIEQMDSEICLKLPKETEISIRKTENLDNMEMENNAVDSVSSEDVPTTANVKEKLILSSKLFGKCSDTKKRKTPKKSKLFTKSVQLWTAKDCKKTTIAEVYMLLGKPSVFKLCYHWLGTSVTRNDNETISQGAEKKEPCAAFPAGLMALIQLAKLSSQISKQADEKGSPDRSATQSRPKSPTTKHTASQCNILKPNQKAEDSSQQLSSSSSSLSNPHGRGVSKVIPVQPLIVESLPVAGFAMPAIPVNRPRRIAANPNKPVQGTKVSAETINWLLRRDRLRNNRQLRRPIVVDRSSNNYKPMKTFSIITQGPNKIGFLPSKPVYAQCSTEPNQYGSSGTMTSNALSTGSSSSLNIETFLGLGDGSAVSNNDEGSDPGNLLHQAAKEAGVAPSTPIKTHNPVNIKDDSKVNMEYTIDQPTAQIVAVVPSMSQGDYIVKNTEVVPTVISRPVNVKDDSMVNMEYTNNQPTPQIIAGVPSMSQGDYMVKNTEVLPSVISQPILQVPADKQHEKLEPRQADSISFNPNSPTVTTTVQSSLPPSLNSTARSASPVVVDALLDISWSSHDVAQSAFSVINEDSLIGNLVNGENDVVLTSFNTESKSKKSDDLTRSLASPSPVLDENSNGPSLTRDNFDLHMTPVKSSDLPVHPWTISTNSRDGLGLSGLLNTPQKVLISDTEDSLDGLFDKKERTSTTITNETRDLAFSPIAETKKTSPSSSKSRHVSQDQTSSNFLSGSDPEVDIQLQCMLNENSVDYIAKFQDLVRQTTDCDELPEIGGDENARDGHQTTIPTLAEFNITPNEVKDNG